MKASPPPVNAGVADLFNPHLQPWLAPGLEHAAGKGKIERPGAARNIVWQTRSLAPTAYENALGDALEQAFDTGADSPEQLVLALNASPVRAPDGGSWTVATFLLDMRRLGV